MNPMIGEVEKMFPPNLSTKVQASKQSESLNRLGIFTNCGLDSAKDRENPVTFLTKYISESILPSHKIGI